jgi:hypothetical protein
VAHLVTLPHEPFTSPRMTRSLPASNKGEEEEERVKCFYDLGLGIFANVWFSIKPPARRNHAGIVVSVKSLTLCIYTM